MNERPKNAIAVVGMACRVPGAPDLESFWANLRDGVESVRRFSAAELAAAGVDAAAIAAPDYVPARAVLADIELFDAGFFGFSRREAEVLDPQQRLFLECAWHALEHAGLDPGAFAGRVGCFAGIGLNTYLLRNLMTRPELLGSLGGFQIVLGNDKDFVPTRAAYLLDLRGPAMAVNTACSSSLVAVQLACQSLLLHQCDAALAGGVAVEAGQDQGYVYQEGGVLSPDGHCRPFDAAARGTVEGSGLGLVVLKRLEDALADGDRIYGLVRGAAVNNDGAAKAGFTAPSPDGQAEVIAETLALAGVAAESIDYVEAHGTGTLLGDPVEIEGLSRAFRLGTPARGYCGIGSVKSNFGHLDTAAGVVGLIKVLLALEHGELPPSLHFKTPNPHLDFAASPFYVVDRRRPWPRVAGRRRRAGISSFGIGGTNAHLVLEEGPPPPAAAPSRAQAVLLLSAKTPAALAALRERLARHWEKEPEESAADVAFTLALGRKPLPWRWAAAAPAATAGAGWAAALRRPAAPRRALDGALTFLLPGQGSQRPAMARALHAGEAAFRASFDAISELVLAAAGWDPRQRILLADPADPAAAAWLERTENAQPAIFAVEVALAALWRSWGLAPAALLGHSVGELAAAHLAGVLSLEDGVAAVLARGRLLAALPAGAMLALPLAPAEAARRLAGLPLEVAAVNGPRRTVVAGPPEAIAAFAAACRAEGIEARRLRTSHAFHSAAVEPAMAGLEAVFGRLDLRPPKIPLLSGVTGDWLDDASATDPAYWARQARQPVLFSAGLGALLAAVPGILLEIGPGSGLAALTREHPGCGEKHAVFSCLGGAGEDADRTLAAALAAAVESGLAPDWNAYFAGEKRRKVVLPGYPFERQSYWIAPAGRPESRAAAPPAAGPQAGTAAPEDMRSVRDRLEAIWRELLGVEEIGPEADFFDLGGHSLLGTVLVSRLRRDLALELELEALFTHPTFAALAEVVEAAAARAAGAPPAATGPPAVPAAPVEAAPGPEAPGAIERRPAGAPPVASFAQERMWFVDRLSPGDAFYNLAAGLRLRGPLDRQALAAALADLADRHQGLRTRFESGDGGPVPVAAAGPPPAIEEADLSGEPEPAAAAAWVRRWAVQPFDLARGPLLRVALLRLGHDDRLLVVAIHHTVADGWSIGILSRDLAALYSRCAGRPAGPLPAPAPISYGDFAAWQRQSFSGAEKERLLDYWRRHLAGAEPLFELPMARAAARRTGGGRPAGRVPVDLDGAAEEALRRVARELGATPFMVLFAAWALLLGRFSGRRELVIGTPVAGRNRAETENLVGCFVNLLPLRIELGAATFGELVGRVRRVALDGFAHQDAPFEKLVEALGAGRGVRHNPVVQAIFTLQNAPAGGGRFADLEIEPQRFELGWAGFDLSLLFEPTAGGLAGELRYDAELYRDGDMQVLARSFGCLLAAALADPGAPPAALPLLGAAQREAMLAAGRPRRRPLVSALPLERFAAQAAARPAALAVTCGASQLSYGELAAAAHRLARLLRRAGVAPGDRVGLCHRRSCELVVALLAIGQAGAAYVPLDPVHPPERRLELAADAGLRLLLTETALAGELAAAANGGPLPELLLLDGDGTRAALAAESAAELAADAFPLAGEQPAYVIYTSGSTGRSKGVVIAQAQVARLLSAAEEHFDFGPADVWTLFHSYAFDFSVWELWGALAYGGRLVVVPLEASRAADTFHRLLLEERVTVLNQTPSAFRQLAEVDARRGGELALRYVIFGGEALDPASLRAWWRRRGEERPALINMYGITETTVHVTFRRMAALDGEAKDGEGPASPAGRPLADLGVYLLDPRLEPVPPGVAGEIYVAGDGLADGYLNRPALTATRFVPSPFAAAGEPGSRLYRSGDLARWVGGEIDYLGRIDHQIKLRGYRIELGEIEAALAAWPGVHEAVALLRGEGEAARILAWVVPAPAAEFDAEACRDALRRRLPEYMVPTAILPLAALPLTVNGKLDRAALPDPESRPGGAPSRRPEGEWERSLAAVWEELLGVDGVGPDDDFFAIGGHSLLATRLATRIRDLFGVELPVREIFEAPQLAAQARQVAAARRREPEEPGVRLGRRPESAPRSLSFGQERLWFLDRLASPATRTAYVVPAAIRLEGNLDAARLEAAFAAVIARHDALRTVVLEVDGEPRPALLSAAAATPPWRRRDLAEEPEPAVAAALAAAMARLTAEPFDLEKGPLLRFELLRLPPRQGLEVHVLHVALHHIAADGWSVGVLVRELSRLYAGESLPPLPVSYADYAAWQRAFLAGGERERQLAYWRGQLGGAAPVLDLAADHPRPAQRSLQGRSERVAIPPQLAQGLRRLGRAAGASSFMVLVAAFAVLLGRYSGRRDLQLGTPVANRTRGELEGLVGFFANTLVLRFDLGGGISFRDLLAAVRGRVLDAFDHQDLPFEVLVEALEPPRSLAHAPIFQVMFAFQNAADGKLELPGLELELLEVPSPRTKFDLSLAVEEGADGGFHGELIYAADLWEAAGIRRFLDHWLALLAGAAAAPDTPIDELALLAPEEEGRILALAENPRPYPLEAPLIRTLEEIAAGCPEAPALRFGAELLSHRQLHAEAAALAHELRRRGAGPESVVGLHLEASGDLLVAILATLKAGAAYLPLDPAWPAARLRYMVEDSGAALVLGHSAFADQLPLATAARLEVDLFRRRPRAADGAADEGGIATLGLPIFADHPAYMLYTSGSTGRPKGALILQRGLASYMAWIVEVFAQAGIRRLPWVTTLGFDSSLKQIFGPLLLGGQVEVVPRAEVTQPEKLARFLNAPGTGLSCVPSLWEVLLEAIEAGQVAPPAGLVALMLGGEALTPRLVRRSLAAAPGTRVLNFYGPTETTATSVQGEVQADRITLGRPVANNRIYVLDPRGRLGPVGLPGELHIGGVGLARGYWGRPALTAEKFVPDPFAPEPGARMYRSGDRGRLRGDGRFEFLGRGDRQVKLRGQRVELGEVEAALAEDPAVGRAFVAVDGDRLAAHLVPAAAPGGEAAGPPPLRGPGGLEALRGRLRERLPEHLVPSRWAVLETLPLLPNGKVDLRALPPARELAREGVARGPRSESERAVEAVWRGLLELDEGVIGVEDSFFDVGGHSLLVVRLQSRLRRDLGLELELVDLFRHPTVGRQAALLDGAEPGPDLAGVAAERAVARREQRVAQGERRRQLRGRES